MSSIQVFLSRSALSVLEVSVLEIGVSAVQRLTIRGDPVQGGILRFGNASLTSSNGAS
jgi:hypothetical protein